ncbi:ADP-ribose diphosphatase [Shewanella morhuae]|uniref:ADP-ribose pyrophosphatase n=1 Tax=Shewanella morhuae TaxID=365591 RepID=A0ABX5HQY7_9GAMM|nr:ADP-ribose diphosphatase [Shewanella morhuae]PTA49282.1 ADP-ribose diphosphatase [Shewanella morhuae]
MKPAVFSQKDIEIIGKKTLYQGFFSLDEYTFKHKLFAGGWSLPVTREVFERGHAVVVLPYDIKQDKIVLIEQVRFPALATTKSPWLMELVAGMIALEETPVDVALRELFEETGLVADNMHFINSYLASPGGSTERFYFYWADIDSSEARGLHGLAEEHEDIRLHVMSREQAYNSMLNGEIDNASTVIGLQWLQLNYQQLR